MTRYLTLFCFAAVLLCFISCQREIYGLPEPAIPTPEVPGNTDTLPEVPPTQVVPPDNMVMTNVQGKVLDENGNPMPNALVKAGNKTSYTNEYGIFRITRIQVPEHFTYITAEHSGYFTGSRTIISSIGQTGFVRIKMIRKQLKSSFSAANGAVVNVDNSSTIELAPNIITTASGEEYKGKVNVYAAVIDPDAEDFNETMPGGLRAINADSQYTALKSYGMVTVNLESETGQQLKIAPGQTATIKMKVPASLVASAPQQIPLWHFGETDGIWREEGNATIQNGWYMGTVSHFSTWNYDIPSNFVFVTLNVRTLKGGVRPYSRVKIIDKQSGAYSDLYTDSAGNIRTWVPKNAPLTIEILTECGGVLHSQDAPPLNEDTHIGEVYINFTRSSHVTGAVRDCNNQMIRSGKAHMFLLGLNYTTEVNDGVFDFYMSQCEGGQNQVDLFITTEGSDIKNHIKTFSITGLTQDLGLMRICQEEQFYEYLNYRIGSDSIRTGDGRMIKTYTGFGSGDSMTRVHFIHNMFDAGAFEITIPFKDSSVHTSIIDNPGQAMLSTERYNPVGPLTVNVTKYGAIGEEVIANFHGMYSHYIYGNIVEMVGEFRVIRTE